MTVFAAMIQSENECLTKENARNLFSIIKIPISDLLIRMLQNIMHSVVAVIAKR